MKLSVQSDAFEPRLPCRFTSSFPACIVCMRVVIKIICTQCNSRRCLMEISTPKSRSRLTQLSPADDDDFIENQDSINKHAIIQSRNHSIIAVVLRHDISGIYRKLGIEDKTVWITLKVVVCPFLSLFVRSPVHPSVRHYCGKSKRSASSYFTSSDHNHNDNDDEDDVKL